MPPKKKVQNNDLINYYETEEIQEFITQHYNPNYNYDTMPLKHPFPTMIVIGSSGSGKSNIVVNIIKMLNGTFNNIFIWTLDKNEPLYNMLQSKIDKDFLHIYEGIESFNKLDIDKFFSNTGQTLLIIDDMCNQKHQEKFCDIAIHGRKMCDNKGISMVYLSQSYYAIPKIIRLQSKYLVLKKIGSDKDTKAIIRESNVHLKPEELIKMYEYCVDDNILNFLFINKGDVAKNMFRKNFSQILNASDFKI